MNKRIQTLADLASQDIISQYCNDEHIKDILASAAGNEEKLRVIREEYAKVIFTDENSGLAGNYPTFPFWERKEYLDLGLPLRVRWDEYGPLCNKLFIFGGNHKSADFEYVLFHGIEGLMQQIAEKQAVVETEKEKEFLDNLYFTCEAIIAWSNAHADVCRRDAACQENIQRKNELLQMADMCERVPYHPATSFREAIQSFYLMFILFPDGLGRLDQYLYPFYQKDIEKNILDRETALDLIEEMFVKIHLKRGNFYGTDHHAVLAGYRTDGENGHNECTSLILQAVSELPTWRPQVSYRITSKTTMEQLQEAVEANYKRPDLVAFLNDDVLVNNLLGIDVSYEDAVNYSVSGCNELILTGCSQLGGLEGLYNLMYSLERLMKDTDTLKDITDFDTFYKAYTDYLSEDMELLFQYSHDRDQLAAQNPDLIQSLFTNGCISSAKSITEGGAKYNACTWTMMGLINLADSLSVIRQFVFEENRFSLLELSAFLEADWNGYENQRSYILNNGRYFGNDDDSVDLLVNKIGASINEIAKDRVPYRGGKYLFGTLTGVEIAHIILGEASGASPDGRHAKDPFAASIAAFPGADKNGMTAYLKSAAKVDGNEWVSSVVVNIKLDRAIADTEEKRARLAALFMTYFKMGGVQLQINYLSADELIKAQQEPEKYRNLRARVTGFSGFFTGFEKNLQDEIINRSLHSC